MVEIQFIDGTSETIEPMPERDPYSYDCKCELFKILVENHYAMFPREFVKSIRYIEV